MRADAPGNGASGFLRPILAAALALIVAGGNAAPARADAIARDAAIGKPVAVRVLPIDNFQILSSRTRFGDLEFTGGLEVTGSDPDFGGMSSLKVSADRSAFLGVMDTGRWFSGRFMRDASGRLSGISDYRIAPILDGAGVPIATKFESDAEGTAVRDHDILVSFERDHRIEIFPLDRPQRSGPIGRIALPFPVAELRSNRSLETVAQSPADGPLKAATITVSELSINAAGDLYAGILDGPDRGTFFVRRHPPYAVSDGDFLPNGDLLLLERTISLKDGFGVRIVRIPGASIRPGATVDGPVIFQAGFGDQIDNMEGLSVNRGKDGQVYLTMVSDDNSSILQRNLFLEFRLATP